MKGIDDLIETVDAYRTEFYQKAIELHNDERLRGMAGQSAYGFTIIGGERYSDKLYYTDQGFKADIPVCIEQGSYCESGRYESRYHYCKIKEGKLVVKGKELLHHFPSLTLEELVRNLEVGIKTLPVYKKAEEKNDKTSRRLNS